MIDARFVPIEKWPGTKRDSWKRQDGRFRANYSKTLDLLEDELRKLRAKNITIECYFSRDEIRNDGWPKSSARPTEPGIVLSFTSRDKEMSFPCDTYKAWENDLRAIALSLEALRSVDRYGVTQHGEQYKGWAKLPEAPASMPVKDALAFINLHSQISITNPEAFRSAYREAARKLHPDTHNGTHEQFVMLGKAKDAIERHYGWDL